MATDDLVQRLRDSGRTRGSLYWEAADLIDSLLARLAEVEQRLSNAVDWMKGCGEAQKRAEQKLAEAERAEGEPVAWIVELGGFRQAMLMPPPEDANVKAIPLYTAPQPQQISYIPLEISSQQITVEQRLRDALEAMGSKKAQSLSAGDLLSVVCDVDAPQITAEDRERARENIRSLSLATDMHITMDGKELDSAIDEAIDTWKEQRRHHED